MLTVDKPLVLATKTNYKFSRLVIDSVGGQLRATVIFNQIGDDNKTAVASKTLYYKPSEFNEFWSKFDSGKFLYEELVAEAKIDTTVTDTVEGDFVNPPEDPKAKFPFNA